jgi:hypothetical protein
MTNESIKGAKADDGRRWISLHHGRYVQYRNNPNTMTKATKSEETKYCHGGCRQTPVSKFTVDPDGRHCDDCMRDEEVVGDWRDDNHAWMYGVDAVDKYRAT